MSVPNFQAFMLPILELFKDSKEHTAKECKERVIKEFSLNTDEIMESVPSGRQTVVDNRVYWSLTYLKKALLLKTVTRGQYIITKRGTELLNTNPDRIDKKLLSQYKEYRVFSKQEDLVGEEETETYINTREETPEEVIHEAYEKINRQLADDLLETILSYNGYYFEKLVMDLLTKMGYGNVNTNTVTKKSNDGGIDGIIYQDKLGLDRICIQAKRWVKGTVGSEEIQKFSGALLQNNVAKGIFITMSTFTKGAKEAAKQIGNIRLIDGQEFTRLMIEYNVGIQINYTYEIKKLDKDYFDMF